MAGRLPFDPADRITLGSIIKTSERRLRPVRLFFGFAAACGLLASPLVVMYGMMRTFDAFASSETTPRPNLLAGGISQSLIEEAIVFAIGALTAAISIAASIKLRRLQKGDGGN